MKKPINRVAIALWVLAIAIPVIEGISVAYTNSLRVHTLPSGMKGFESYWLISNIVTQLRVGLTNFALLGGLGFLIELADQIRWELRSRGKL